MIRRTLMRRAYNSGRWERARHYAYQLISNRKEQPLARSVIIRSYWNEGDYEKVVQLNEEWDHEFDELLQRNSKTVPKNPDGEPTYSSRVQSWHTSQPKPSSDMDFDSEVMENNFLQEGQRLWMKHPMGWTFWDMPEAFELDATHVDLLRLTAEILLYPWHRNARQELEKTRKKGTIPALAFSAGTDSTAAAVVMPEQTVLGYHRRTVDSILDHRNAERLLAHMQSKDRTIVDVPSNHELIRTYHHKQIGFSTDFACATHLILLADLYGFGAIGFGMPLDNTYLMKGRKFRNFAQTDYFQYWSKRFEDAGLELLLPIAGISEAGCLLICQKSGISEHMNSCLRGDGLNGCGKCWKCFHKNGPLGREFNIKAREIQTFLNRKPLPTATHALWAIKELKMESETPHLSDLLLNDFSWWTKVYPPSEKLHSIEWRDLLNEKLYTYLEQMEQPYVLETFNLYNE